MRYVNALNRARAYEVLIIHLNEPVNSDENGWRPTDWQAASRFLLRYEDRRRAKTAYRLARIVPDTTSLDVKLPPTLKNGTAPPVTCGSWPSQRVA